MMLSIRLSTGSALALLLVAAGCGSAAGPVGQGNGQTWLASNQPPPSDPKYRESREVAEVAGVVTAVDGSVAPPSGWQRWYLVGEATRTITIRADDAVEWKLGYRIEQGDPAVDATPTLQALVGSRVRLVYRAVRSFGSAAGFVLSDDHGVVLAMDLATYGDPLKPDDVPGLTVADGTVLGTVKNDCFDRRNTALVFAGDTSAEVRPGDQAAVSIKGARYTALALFSFKAAGELRCTDIAGEGRGWAVSRIP
jgi:hypothetical protein